MYTSGLALILIGDSSSMWHSCRPRLDVAPARILQMLDLRVLIRLFDSQRSLLASVHTYAALRVAITALRCCCVCGATENAGMENAGLENVGANRMGGNRKTGKRRTKIQGWKGWQGWKTREHHVYG